MPKAVPLQVSFAAGEVSPRLYARTDARGYKEGAKLLRNMLTISQGPTKRRPGTFVRASYAGVSNVRMIPFPVAENEAYLLVFYNNQLQIFNEVGDPVRPNYVLNPRFQFAGSNWTAFVGSPPNAGVVTFNIGSANLNPTPTNPAAIRQNVTGLAENTTYTVRVAGTATSFLLRLGSTPGASDYGVAVSAGNTATLTFTTPAGITNAHVEVSADASSGPSSVIFSVSMTTTADAAAIFNTPYNQNTLQFIQYEMAPAGRLMYFANPVVAPQKLSLTGAVWAFEAVVFTTPPPDWATNNYPAALTFFQGRLWFGGTLQQPSKFWGSKSGVYENFTTGTLADDSVLYTIAKRGAIRWMQGLKTLLVGTEVGEFVITSEAGVITPSDIVIEPQSAYGSAPHQSIQLGNQILYVSPDGRKLRSMGYRFEEQGWVTQDLTFASEHITEGRIFEISYAQNPESMVWMVDVLGRLIGCTYDRPNNIIGWHLHETPGIFWTALCTLRLAGNDMLFVAGRVELAGGPTTVLAIMISPNVRSPFMDLAKTTISPTPTTQFSGYGYLEGKTVGVMADDAAHPDVVVTGGIITLQANALKVVAGLKYKSQVVTLPVEISQHPQASEAMMKRMNRIFLRIQASRLPIINGVRPPTRHPSTPMNTVDPLEYQDVFVSSLGWDRLQSITIEEDLPVDMHILGTFAEMAAEMPG